MDDDRVWSFEKGLWLGDADRYRDLVDDECLMVLPQPPFVLNGKQATEAVANTPRWNEVELSKRQVARPEEGLIVIAYHARASREDESYEAYCTSTLRRISHEDWRVVQHQQTTPVAIPGKSEG